MMNKKRKRVKALLPDSRSWHDSIITMRFVTAFMLACCAGAAPAAAMHWQPAPEKTGLHQNHMPGKAFMLTNAGGVTLRILHPDLASSPLVPGNNDTIGIKSTGKNNYHALIASRQTNTMTETAIRYVYMHGRPTGHSPSALTAAAKSDLEIVPAPLPREHRLYTSNHPAKFLLRFNRVPLKNFPVAVNTSNGSRLNLKTDEKGMLSIHIPDDFASVKPGSSNNPPAEWRIEAVYSRNGRNFRTVLSAAYHADPNHWQPLSWGLAAVAGGMLVTGMAGLRRRNTRVPARSGKAVRKKAKD